MISVNEFRDYVKFVQQKIDQLTSEFTQLRSVADQIREKAIEIDHECFRHQHNSFDQEIEIPPTVSTDVEIEESQTCTQLNQETPNEFETDNQPTNAIKRRKTRVRRKIGANQVCNQSI